MAPQNNSKKSCATCGATDVKMMYCTRCKNVSYCNTACQKAQWKEHKNICFPPGAKCTRCLQIITNENRNVCSVPHPTHMLLDGPSSFGAGACSWTFDCTACKMSFTKESPDFNCKDTAPITKGAKFCYLGPHTIKPLPDHDERRVSDDVLVLRVGPDIQRQIDEIPSTMPNVRILTIESTGCYDDSICPKLEVSMPNLKVLRCDDVVFSEITLNADLTPNIKELYMKNVPDDCILNIVLPELVSFTMHYYGPPHDDGDWINDMLAAATKLERFDSYKLRVGPELHFASNNLQCIRLHRAELLYSLSIYAPQLEELSLQGCYGLEGDLVIRTSHPNLPRWTRSPPSKFVVDTTNACFSRSIANTLQTNPRIIWDEGEDEDGGGGNPMESFLAMMNGLSGM